MVAHNNGEQSMRRTFRAGETVVLTATVEIDHDARNEYLFLQLGETSFAITAKDAEAVTVKHSIFKVGDWIGGVNPSHAHYNTARQIIHMHNEQAVIRNVETDTIEVLHVANIRRVDAPAAKPGSPGLEADMPLKLAGDDPLKDRLVPRMASDGDDIAF
jgi:hypothetical protein